MTTPLTNKVAAALHHLQADGAINRGDVASVIRELAAELAEANRQLQMHRDYGRGDYWMWQKDGGNSAQSLVCPILIHADDMRDLLSQLAAKTAELTELRYELLPKNPCTCVADGDDGTVAHLCQWHKDYFGEKV